ncbi:MAG: hypothetical protein OXF43_00830 [Gammaproteobacteria bacterium]|nr:hypothetical protein [Gammaproteobacteria bacterium]
MAGKRELEDPLSWLIAPVAEKEFFDNHYERRALHCGRDDPLRFAALLSLNRLDEIIASAELPGPSLTMARSKPPLERADYTFKSGNINRGAVIRHFQRGATLILNQLQRADESLAEFCRALEEVFSCRVQTNAYLTPPGSQGFNTHFDDHDVFIIQVSGAKRWRLYEKPVENPYRGEGFDSSEHSAGKLDEEFLLREGECLYIPRGLMHDASSHGDAPSLHITTGLLVKKWADLMLEAVAEVALRNPKFRRSLPPGFAGPGEGAAALETQFRELVGEFAEQAHFEPVLAYFQDSFLTRRRPALRGALLDAAKPPSHSARYIRRPYLQATLRRSGSKAVITGPGGDVHFELGAISGLEIFLSGAAFSAEDFSELETGKRAEAIRRLSAFGLIERLR